MKKNPLYDSDGYLNFFIFAYNNRPVPELIAAVKTTPDGKHFKLKYVEKFVKNPKNFSIDPLHLPVSSRVFESSEPPGPFTDSAPDHWGRSLMDHVLERKLEEIEYFLFSGAERFGDLEPSLSPEKIQPTAKYIEGASSKQKKKKLASFDEIAFAIYKIMDGMELTDKLKHIVSEQLSLGGSRPKASILHKGTPSIIKFELPQDSFDAPRFEYATMQLASLCGIKIPKINLISKNIHQTTRDILIVERFDRSLNNKQLLRMGVLSAESLLRGIHKKKQGYFHIARIIKRVGDKEYFEQDLTELFQRMIFNVLTANIDDHARNLSFLRETNKIRLAPAYDLITSTKPENSHSLALTKDLFKPEPEKILEFTSEFNLTRTVAIKLIKDIRDIIEDRWKETFLSSGATKRDIKIFEKTYAFRLGLFRRLF